MANPAKKSQKDKTSKLLKENQTLRQQNQELKGKLATMGKMYLIQNEYVNQLQQENSRLLDCMNHGAIAMMAYHDSFKN